MYGRHPSHTTSVITRPQNQGEEAGDGPPGRQPRHMTAVSSGPQNRVDEAGDAPSESLSSYADPSRGLTLYAGSNGDESQKDTQHNTTQHNTT